MAQQPRGRPPSQAPPPLGRGRNALTALGGGVLVLAVAGGAWALFGRDSKDDPTSAIGPKVPSAAPTNPVLGPVAPGTTPKPAVTATSTSPVAAAPTKAAATKAPTTAPVVKPTATAVATKAPTTPVTKPVAKPTVTAPQQGGTVAKKDYTFKVARGDTLWQLAEQVLAATGRSTSNATVASFVTELYQSNAAVIGSDPDLILPGQTIVWPTGL